MLINAQKLSEIYAENSKNKTIDEKKYKVCSVVKVTGYK